MMQAVNSALEILERLSRNVTKKHSLSKLTNPLSRHHDTCVNILKTMQSRL